MDNNIGYVEVWETLGMILKKVPEIVSRLEKASNEDYSDKWWARSIYNLVLLIQQYPSITDAIYKSGHPEIFIRAWFTTSRDPEHAREFVEWLDEEGYAEELINSIGLATWPWLNHYFTLGSITYPDNLEPFVTHPSIAVFLAQRIEDLQREREESRSRLHYARMVMDGLLDLETLQKAERIVEAARETGQQPTTNE